MSKTKTVMTTFLTIWSLWLIFGLSKNYKEILTQVGVKLWTKQGFEELCQSEKLKNTIDCLYPIGDYVTEFSAAFNTWSFMQIFVIAPFFVLIVLAMILYLIRIIFVRSNHKNWSE